MKILFFELNHPLENQLRTEFANDQFFGFFEPLTQEFIPADHEDTQIISIFLHSRITKKILDKFPHLQLIITRTTGLDHIDIDAVKDRNITLINAPTYASEAVAEYTFALLLMLSRKIKQSLLSCETSEQDFEKLKGFELANKTLGIIGLGNIGKKVAHIAQAFTMKIIVHDDFQKSQFSDAFNFVDLPTLFKKSDIITFHVPLNPDTFHLLNMNNLNNLKAGVFIINTARGGIIQTAALLQGLENGIIAGAGLDVLEEEQLTKKPLERFNDDQKSIQKYMIVLQNYELCKKPNVIVTCHNAFNTEESFKQIIKITVQSIQNWKRNFHA